MMMILVMMMMMMMVCVCVCVYVCKFSTFIKQFHNETLISFTPNFPIHGSVGFSRRRFI